MSHQIVSTNRCKPGSLIESPKNSDRQLRPLAASILRDISDAVLLVDSDTRVLSGNSAAARLLGMRMRDLTQIRLDELLDPSTLYALCERTATRRRAVSPSGTLTLTRKDGTEHAVNTIVRAVFGEETLTKYLVTLHDHTEEKQLTEGLRKCTNEKREAHEWERNRLSRMLHDDLLQDLLAIAINVECLPDRCNGGTNRCNARDVAAQARELAERIRHMTHAMRAGILDRMAFVPAIRTIVKESNTDTLRSTLRVRGKIVQMPWSAETTLYRMVLELLTNVRKHSEATEVVTTMAFHKSDVTVTVEDNGIGFMQTPDPVTLAGRGKYGIVGIYERAENLDASLDISSRPGSGTRVRIVVPYASEKVQEIRAKVWPGTPELLSPTTKAAHERAGSVGAKVPVDTSADTCHESIAHA